MCNANKAITAILHVIYRGRRVRGSLWLIKLDKSPGQTAATLPRTRRPRYIT